jgi:hypothetical protein
MAKIKVLFERLSNKIKEYLGNGNAINSLHADMQGGRFTNEMTTQEKAKETAVFRNDYRVENEAKKALNNKYKEIEWIGKAKNLKAISLRTSKYINDILGHENTDIKTQRKNIEKWYRENLQGHKLSRKEIKGNVLLSRSGISKSISSGSDRSRLSLIPFLEDIITNGQISKIKTDDGSHCGIKYWQYVRGIVKIGNNDNIVGQVDIATDENGNRFYFIHDITKEIKKEVEEQSGQKPNAPQPL